MKQVEFFFDLSSPWTYLAFSRLEALIARQQAELIWYPILVGGVFNAVNDSVYEQRANPNPVKGRYYLKDLQDWARYCEVKIGQPPVFPVRAVELMRAAIVAQEKKCISAFCWAAFKAYWGELKDVSQVEERAALCVAAGMDPVETERRIADEDVKTRLRENTELLISRGGFGSPSFFVNGTDMYFGNDRLPLLEHALAALD